MKDPRNSKKCPKCKTWIEKNQGCNRIEYMCWLCLQVFPTRNDVYDY